MLKGQARLFGERHEQLGQPLRQPFDVLDDGELEAGDTAVIFFE